MPDQRRTVVQTANVYTDTQEYPNLTRAWTDEVHVDRDRATKSKLVATRPFRPEDGLDYASTLTTATVTV